MGVALGKLAQEDPSFRVQTDEETGQTIISGMGELHLDIIVDRMRREFKVEANIGKPQVAYRETIRQSVEQEGKFVRQSGGRGQFGHCWIRFAPADEGQEGLQFVNEVVGGVVPKEYIPAIQKGIENAKKEMITVPVINGTIPHRQEMKYAGAHVLIRPASPGTGVIAGGAMRAVLESAGIKNVLAKSLGSSNPANVVKATFNALKALRDAKAIAQTRGISVTKVFQG